MTPSFLCSHRCCFCWRDIGFTPSEWKGKVDSPKEIVDGCVKAHVEYLQGFGGSARADYKRFKEALKPLHFAISLFGEPTFYPKLPELIDEIHRREMTSFLVTNGTNLDMLKKLLKHQPTQLYVTLPAPDEKTYEKVCKPLVKNGWSKIQESLELLSRFKCRKAIRLTLVKDINMVNAEGYAKILKNVEADFIELKAYMWVGYSIERLSIENMPRHPEVRKFAEEVAGLAGLKIIDEKENSRVVLLMKKDRKDRVMRF
tara:strand:- start:352 stop:1125 length:774 start_codon:yes stop_codon:yes gene_type:complete